MPRFAVLAFGFAAFCLWTGLLILIFARLGPRGWAFGLGLGILLALAHAVILGRLEGHAPKVMAALFYGVLAATAGWSLFETGKRALITEVMSLQLAVGLLGLFFVFWRYRLERRSSVPPHGYEAS